MNKLQIGLLIAGIGITILLFNLPQTLVSNPSKKMDATEKSANSEMIPHSFSPISFSSSEMKKIAKWKNQIAKSYSPILDSLVTIYKNHLYYDSAAYYAIRIYEIKKTDNAALNVANIYYQAFETEQDNQRKQEYAKQARTLYEELLQKNPALHTAKVKLGLLIVVSENPMQGVKMIREVLEQDPTNKEALYQLGMLSIQSKQYDKAKERYQQLLKYYPNDTLSHYWLGISYKELGEMPNAKKEFEWVKAHLENTTTLSDSLLIRDVEYQLSQTH